MADSPARPGGRKLPTFVAIGLVGLVVVVGVGAAVVSGTGASRQTPRPTMVALASPSSGATPEPTRPAAATPTAPPSPTGSPTNPLSGRFTAAGSLPTARQSFAAVLLHDGRVFMVGGGGSNSGGNMKADIYDPSTRTFSQTRTMSAGRYIERATLLDDGDVLIDGDSSPTAPSRAILFRPQTNKYSYTGAMRRPRKDATATLLADGRVLVAGGATCSNNNDDRTCVGLASAEIYNPKTRSFAATGSMATGRFYQTATLLKDGRVLIAGGAATGRSAAALSSAELYNPRTGKFSPAGSMAYPRLAHTATLLSNGMVLVAGGQASEVNPASGLSSAELFDPGVDTFSAAGPMVLIRQAHTATLLPDGRVLLVGGGDTGTTTQQAELYDPPTNTFALTGSLPSTLMMQTATLLKDGRVFIAGGYRGGQTQKSCELYTP